MPEHILIIPPLAFLVVLAITMFFSFILSKIAFIGKTHGDNDEGREPYACGEDFSGHMIQPDYSQFFPFAFFFTILHVVTMVVATVPVENWESLSIAVVYVLGAAAGLWVLLRD